MQASYWAIDALLIGELGEPDESGVFRSELYAVPNRHGDARFGRGVLVAHVVGVA